MEWLVVSVGWGKWLKGRGIFFLWGGDHDTLSLIAENNYEDY
jgi:hypothetical protein